MRAQRISHPPDWSGLAVAGMLLLSPWLLGYSSNVATLAISFSAFVLLIVSAIALDEVDDDEAPEYFVVGAWLLISPWVLGFWSDTSALLTQTLFGVGVIAHAARAICGRSTVVATRRRS